MGAMYEPKGKAAETVAIEARCPLFCLQLYISGLAPSYGWVSLASSCSKSADMEHKAGRQDTFW